MAAEKGEKKMSKRNTARQKGRDRGQMQHRSAFHDLLRVPRLRLFMAILCTIALTFGMGNWAADMKEPVQAAETEPAMGALCAAEYYGHGWTDWVPDNSPLFVSGSYPTAFRAALSNQPEGSTGTIQYEVNVSGSGWTGTCENGQTAGMEGGEMPLEGIRVWLNGSIAELYDVFTRVLTDGQWGDWAVNGSEAGEVGVGKHIDGIRIAVVKKGEQSVETASTVDPSRPMVALTFDDGPGRFDAQILGALESVGGHATFFMVGNRVGDHADLVQRMAADGCELGNHSWNHDNFSKIPAAAIQNSVQQTNSAIQSAAGSPATVVRPPYGATGGSCMQALGAMGYAAVLWRIDTLDWKTRNADQTVNTVLSQVRDGDIILMHSIYQQSADAASRIIPELVNRGFQLVTVTELANARGGMVPGAKYGAFHQ